MAKLHIICGNCGRNDMFMYKINPQGQDFGDHFKPSVWITCRNCDTLHDLQDTVKEDPA